MLEHMIGLALLISIVAALVAVFRPGTHRKAVFVLTGLMVATFGLTLLATTRHDPANPFAAIGPAILGTLVSLVLAAAALVSALTGRRQG